MKPTIELFKLTPEHKKALAAIGALCGVKQDSVLLVLEYVAYAAVLSALDECGGGEKKVRFAIPLIGDLVYDAENDALEASLTQSLKKICKDALVDNDVAELKKYFEDKWLYALTDEIENA